MNNMLNINVIVGKIQAVNGKNILQHANTMNVIKQVTLKIPKNSPVFIAKVNGQVENEMIPFPASFNNFLTVYFVSPAWRSFLSNSTSACLKPIQGVNPLK